MPITVTAPRGVLTPAGQREILPQLSAALIEASGGTGNSFLTSIVGGTVHILDPDDIYAGLVNRPVVMVELKLPDIGLASLEARAAFITAATDIVERLTVAGHERENTLVNILNAPSGAWGVAGRAYTGDDLIAAITEAAPVTEAAAITEAAPTTTTAVRPGEVVTTASE
jgi:phenylpyruvate tautomerase PptA (4-oxalocrotonate tautomerase family)